MANVGTTTWVGYVEPLLSRVGPEGPRLDGFSLAESQAHPSLPSWQNEVRWDAGISQLVPMLGYQAVQTLPIPPVEHFHKRAWRTESAAYVYWDSTNPAAPYPGGGTLNPLLGTILLRWST